MKRLLIPIFGVALAAAALIAAPEKPDSCEPCEPGCCSGQGQGCCK